MIKSKETKGVDDGLEMCGHCDKLFAWVDGLCEDCWRCPECQSSFCADCSSDPHAAGCTWKFEI